MAFLKKVSKLVHEAHAVTVFIRKRLNLSESSLMDVQT